MLRTWVIADPGLIVKVLRSQHAVILSISDMLHAVERKYGVELPNVRFAGRHLPLFLEGDAHTARRRAFSKYLADRLSELEIRLPEFAGRHFDPLRMRGEVELVSQVTGPLVRDINSIFVQRPLTPDIASLNLLDLFALNKSVARFRDLELRVRKAAAFLAADNENEELLGCRFAALTMGFETLMAMITDGFVSAFGDLADQGGSHAVLPVFPVETGVPVTYRKAESDFEMEGHNFKAGDLLRLQLQTLGYSERDVDRKWIFGAGTHSCVGKQASLRIWALLKQAFDRIGVRGRVRTCEVMPSHFIVRHNSVYIEVH